MDVCPPLYQCPSIHADRAPSNIWAPERQKDVVLVCYGRPNAHYFIDSISRLWRNITTFRLGFVVLCAPIILRVFLYHPRHITMVRLCRAGNHTWNADQLSRNRLILRRREWQFPLPFIHPVLI